MAIEDLPVVYTYHGDGAARVFEFASALDAAEDLGVVLEDAAGKRIVLAYGTGYTVRVVPDPYGAPARAEATLAAAPPAGVRVVLARGTPATQETVWNNQGPTVPKVIERAVDKLTLIAQEQRAGLAAADAGREELGERLEDEEAAREGADAALQAGLNAEAAARQQGDSSEALARQNADATLQASLNAHLNNKANPHAVTAAQAGAAAANDPRLSDARPPTAHAASHAAGGADPLAPAAIGAMPTAPGDGKQYVGKGGGWVESAGVADTSVFFYPDGQGGLRLREATDSVLESAYFARTSTGVSLKGAL